MTSDWIKSTVKATQDRIFKIYCFSKFQIHCYYYSSNVFKSLQSVHLIIGSFVRVYHQLLKNIFKGFRQNTIVFGFLTPQLMDDAACNKPFSVGKT